MKRIGLVVGISLVLFLIAGGIAWAQTPTPHGPFTEDTDLCAACHRIHTALSKPQIREIGVVSLCIDCHKGTGADNNVREGIYVADGEPDHQWGTPNEKLLGGGFLKVGGTAGTDTTSRHGIDGLTASPGKKAWGYPTQELPNLLTCISCHGPHRSDNYRMLRKSPNNVTPGINVTWTKPGDRHSPPDEDRGYTDDELENRLNVKSGISDWCVACHQGYSTSESGGYYRHKVNVDTLYRIPGDDTDTWLTDPARNPDFKLPLVDKTGDGLSSDDEISCLTCHRAHGSEVAMEGYAQLPSRQDSQGNQLPAGTDSMLLRLKNRGVCENCHQMPSPGW